MIVRYEAVRAGTNVITVFWDVTPCIKIHRNVSNDSDDISASSSRGSSYVDPLARLTVNEIQACPTFVPLGEMGGQTRLTKLESFHNMDTSHFPHMT